MNELNDKNLEKVVGGAGQISDAALFFESEAHTLLSNHVKNNDPTTEKDLGNGYVLKLTYCRFSYDSKSNQWQGSYEFKVYFNGAFHYGGGSNDYIL